MPLPSGAPTAPDDTPRPRRRGVMRALLATVVFPILLGIVVLLVLTNTPWGTERVRRLAISQGNARLNGRLDVARLEGNLLTGATLTDVHLVDSARRPVFTARRVRVRYGLWAALQRRVEISSMVLDTPVVVLDRQPGARWNFQSLLKSSGAAKDTSKHGAAPELTNITIHHGQLVYRRPWSPDSTLSAAARDSATAKALIATARKRTERVTGGYQRVLEYRDIDARLASVLLAQQGRPTSVEIAALSMIGEPYRPPTIEVRSLTGVLFVSKDSLWWRGAHMTLPGSMVSGDGTIGFHHSGFLLDLTGSPVALADLRWLDPALPAEGGGTVRYTMRLRGDTAAFAIANTDLRLRGASLVGNADVARVSPPHGRSELLVRSADLTVSRLSTAIVHALAPGVPIRRNGTLDGHVVVSGASDALRLDADVAFDDVLAGRSRLTAHGGLGIAGGIRARELALGLAPLQLATLRGAGIKLPVGGTLAGRATVSGGAGDRWNVAGDLTHLERGERSRVTGTGQYDPASKRVVADARLEPLSLVTVGRLAPGAQLRGAVAGRVQAQGTTRDLRLNGALHSTSGGGAFQTRGTVALRGARTRYDVAATLDALNANALSRRAPQTLLSGTIAARGTGLSPATMNAVLNADLAHSRYDTFAVDELRAHLAAAGGLLRVDTMDALAHGVRASAVGSLGLTARRTGELQFAATVDSMGALRGLIPGHDTGFVRAASGRQRLRLVAARADSARRAEEVRIERVALGLPEGVVLVVDSLPPVRRDSLAGSLAVNGTLRGNVKELGIDAVVRGAGLVVRGNSVQRLSASIASPRMLDRSTALRVQLDADSIEAGGYGFERAHTEGSWRDCSLATTVQLRQDSLVSYAAAGTFALPGAGIQRIGLDSLRATFDTLVWRLAHAGSVRLDHGSVAIDSIDFRSSVGGRLFADGTLPRDGAARLDVAAANVRVATVLQAMQRDAIADGTIGVRVQLTGTRTAPVLAGHATLRQASYQDVRAPDADVDASYRDRRLALSGAATDSTGRRVLAATSALPVELGLGGAGGSRLLPGPIVADVAMDSLALAALPLPSRTLQDVRGMLVGDAHLRGTWTAPLYTGHAGLRDGGFVLASTGMHVQGAVADARLIGDTLRLDSLVAHARGLLRAQGTLDLSDRAHPMVRFTATGDDVRLMDQQRGLVDANAELSAVGPLDALRVTGTGEMKGGYLALKQFRKDLLRVKAPGELTFFTVFDTSAAPGDSVRRQLAALEHRRVAIIADLSLIVDRGNYYRNRPDANTEFYTGAGETVTAHLDQRTSDQWAVGFVRIGAGVAFFRTRPFTPARGALTFGPHSDAPGIVQQVGERLLWEPGRGWFPLQLLTGGTSKAPAIGLESGTLFPIRGRELNSYLTLGRASTSLLQQTGSSLSGSPSWSGQLSGESGALARRQQAATALGVVLHDIGTGATKEYGLDAFSVSPADVPTELVFGKTGGVRGALVEGGRYVTTDRYVAAQLRLTTGIPGFRLAQRYGTAYRVDVGIEPRFLFRAPEELGITHPTVRTGVFGLFLTRMWDF